MTYPCPARDKSDIIFLMDLPSLALRMPPTFSAMKNLGLNFSRIGMPYEYRGPNEPSIPFCSPTKLKSLHGKP